jgi:hypothetical protein
MVTIFNINIFYQLHEPNMAVEELPHRFIKNVLMFGGQTLCPR